MLERHSGCTVESTPLYYRGDPGKSLLVMLNRVCRPVPLIGSSFDPLLAAGCGLVTESSRADIFRGRVCTSSSHAFDSPKQQGLAESPLDASDVTVVATKVVPFHLALLQDNAVDTRLHQRIDAGDLSFQQPQTLCYLKRDWSTRQRCESG